jgi:hypothetical protein
MSDLIFMDFLLQVIDSRKLKYSGGRISITTDSAGDILFRSAVDMQGDSYNGYRQRYRDPR